MNQGVCLILRVRNRSIYLSLALRKTPPGATYSIKAKNGERVRGSEIPRRWAVHAAGRAPHLYLSREFTWDRHLKQRIATSTPADIRAALRRLIDPSHFVTIKAGDFANSGK